MMNVLHRSNLRGLIKCKQCNFYNGTRALACKNPKCSLASLRKVKRKTSLDIVRLICKADRNLYSVQVRERDPNLRNFVSITDKIISSDESGSIISRNAICFIDTCKYDSNDVNISCKHVKTSVESTEKTATALAIDESVLNSIKISDKWKMTLWNWYRESETIIPIVQRINSTTFVVRCDVSLKFSAGLLHIQFTMSEDEVVDLASPCYSCACKNDRCDHLLLLLAALLSSASLKMEFQRRLSSFGDLVDMKMIYPVEIPSIAKASETVAKDGFNEVLVSATEIPIKTCSSLGTIATVTVDDLNNIELIQIPTSSTIDNRLILSDESSPLDKHELNDAFELPTDIESMGMDSIRIVNEDANIQNLELIDCQIELMDQFNLTDHIELSNDEIQLKEDDDYLRVENICDMPDFFNIYQNTIMVEDELDAVDNVADTVHPIVNKRRKVTHKVKKSRNSGVGVDLEASKKCDVTTTDVEISEKFTSWLDSIIESINMTMNYAGDGCPDPLVFRIPHAFFEHLRKRFTVGSRKRLPSFVKTFDSGKYKSLTMFCWKFTNVNLLKSIFKTRNMCLDVEKSFEEIDGVFRARTRETVDLDVAALQKTKNVYRKIRPTDYRTFLKIRVPQNGRKISDERSGEFILEWIPSVLPKSKYGDLIIKFQYGHIRNGKTVKINDIQCPRDSHW